MTVLQRIKLMDAARKVSEINTLAALGIRQAYYLDDAENIVKQVSDQISVGAEESTARATSRELVNIVKEIIGNT